jgi:predicted LPLAT superfamily acyltransferase
MTIGIEQVDLIMGRAKVGYAEAKAALEKCNGSTVDALVYLEEQNKIKQRAIGQPGNSLADNVMGLINKGNHTRLVIRKKGKDKINLSVNVAIVVGLFAAPVAAAGIVLALFTGHRIRFEKDDGSAVQANIILDKVSSAVESARESLVSNRNCNSEENS